MLGGYLDAMRAETHRTRTADRIDPSAKVPPPCTIGDLIQHDSQL